MPFIETADRTTLFVTDWGSGPPVVFTHARGLRSDQWAYQIQRLLAFIKGPPAPQPGLPHHART